MSPRRHGTSVSVRQPTSAYPVNKFAGLAASGADALSFFGAGRKRDLAHSIAARRRRGEADQTAENLLKGGLSDNDVYASADGDSLLDLASCGALREYVGRPRRRWGGFSDQAHALKTKWGREYAAFCAAKGIEQVVQVVVRAPVSVHPLTCLRDKHAKDSARLGDRIRYGSRCIAPGMACDMIAAEVRSVGQHGKEVDLHFHLAIRASSEACLAMRTYFQASGWAWWDSLSGGSSDAERYPGALAQYASKSLAEAIRRANVQGLPFSSENLAELRRQTRHLTMTRASGAFRAWKGQLDREGLVVIEDEEGRLATRSRRRVSALARLRDRLFTSTGARLLCVTLYDFGNGIMRPAIRVRGPQNITFAEIGRTYQITDAVSAAQRALSSLGRTAIPECMSHTAGGDEGRPSPSSDSPPPTVGPYLFCLSVTPTRPHFPPLKELYSTSASSPHVQTPSPGPPR